MKSEIPFPPEIPLDPIRSYEDSLKCYRDLKTSLDTARAEGKVEGKVEGKIEEKIEGKIEGIKEGKIETATMALKMGISVKEISELTGLSEIEINNIK